MCNLRLTSSSIGSEEDFNMANGDTSSQDSGQQNVNQRPAMNQFRKQKVNAEIEGTEYPACLLHFMIMQYDCCMTIFG